MKTLKFFFRKHRETANSIEMLYGNLDESLISHECLQLPYVGASPIIMLKNMWYAWKHKGEINFITGEVYYIALVLGKNTVATYHDVLSAGQNGSWLNKKLTRLLFFTLPLHICKKIICISEQTKKELISILPSCEKKITVIDNPVSTKIGYKEKIFNSDCPRILHIGTKSNKNLERVTLALKGINCHLDIVGRLTFEQIALLEENKISYSNYCTIPYEQIIELYENCDIVSFPSMYEGFGLPIIEANAVGRPVLAGDIDILRYVGANAAHYVDPYSIDSIRNGFLQLFENQRLRSVLCNNGLENAKRFSTSAIAKKYNEVFASMML